MLSKGWLKKQEKENRFGKYDTIMSTDRALVNKTHNFTFFLFFYFYFSEITEIEKVNLSNLF